MVDVLGAGRAETCSVCQAGSARDGTPSCGHDAFGHHHEAARGRNQSELPLEHDWFASRWSLDSHQRIKLSHLQYKETQARRRKETRKTQPSYFSASRALATADSAQALS